MLSRSSFPWRIVALVSVKVEEKKGDIVRLISPGLEAIMGSRRRKVQGSARELFAELPTLSKLRCPLFSPRIIDRLASTAEPDDRPPRAMSRSRGGESR